MMPDIRRSAGHDRSGRIYRHAQLAVAMVPGWNNLNTLPKMGLVGGIVLRAAFNINNYGQVVAAGSPGTTVYPADLGGQPHKKEVDLWHPIINESRREGGDVLANLRVLGSDRKTVSHDDVGRPPPECVPHYAIAFEGKTSAWTANGLRDSRASCWHRETNCQWELADQFE
jgi:hypothetical protein